MQPFQFNSSLRVRFNGNQIRISVLTLAVIFLTLLTTTVLGNAKQFKFTNKTGQHANDLHIEFSKAVTFSPNPNDPGTPIQNPPGTFKEASGSGSSTIDLAQGATGVGVAADGSVVITVEWAGGNPPEIRKAYWTKSNTLTPNERNDRLGNYLTYDRANATFAMAPATGNGMLLVVIDGNANIFQSLPGEDAMVAAQRFGQFINNIPFGEVTNFIPSTSGPSVFFTGNSFGDGPNILVDILVQDATQPVNIQFFPFPMPPNFLTSDVLDAHTVQIDWEPDPLPLQIEIELVQLNLHGAAPVIINIPGPANSHVLTGLQAGTEYGWRVKKMYPPYPPAGSGPEFSVPMSFFDIFVTICPTPEPTFVNPIQKKAARINWTPVPGSLGYELRGGVVGATGFAKILIPGGNVAHRDVYNLNPGTKYWYKVRTYCTLNPTVTSPWSEVDTFMTLPGTGPKLQWTGDQFSFEEDGITGISAWPNPAVSNLTVSIPEIYEENITIRLMDLTGRTHISRMVDSPQSVTLSLDGLPAGVWFLTAESATAKETTKIIIAR